MSVVRLFLSGLLVASGLVLGAFTLHGYLDPQWAQKQAAGAQAREAVWTASVDASQDRGTAATPRSDQPASEIKAPAPPAAKPRPRPEVTSADPKAAAKPALKKKAAENPAPADKTKPAPQPKAQQASFDWFDKLFGKN